METYTFFIEDKRYKVPTVEFVIVRDAERARQLATERLVSSRHHLSVEVCQGREMLFQIPQQSA